MSVLVIIRIPKGRYQIGLTIRVVIFLTKVKNLVSPIVEGPGKSGPRVHCAVRVMICLAHISQFPSPAVVAPGVYGTRIRCAIGVRIKLDYRSLQTLVRGGSLRVYFVNCPVSTAVNERLSYSQNPIGKGV